ncbi:MAG: polynucleotide 5'-hydroxyl-kinase [Anaerolineae bacterium]|jgi:polynucleotide 5'-hydroxyl-kinase GRC3/NOL9
MVPPAWKHLRAADRQGTIMILGASDTGKSTLARYLFQFAARQGAVAAYLDADVGQSCLGLPTTLNLALNTEPGDDRFPPQGAQAAFFLGATTPRGHMLPAITGAHRLQREALARGAETIVVDTTGLVDKSRGGKALKQWKIELLAPDLVVGLQRGRELEPILWPLRRDSRTRVVELPVSPHAVQRTREARIARRRARLAAYFARARPRLLNLKKMAVYDLERLTAGALLGFQDSAGLCLGLGAVEEADRGQGTIVVQTPLEALEGVASVRLGAARWDLTGQREH